VPRWLSRLFVSSALLLLLGCEAEPVSTKPTTFVVLGHVRELTTDVIALLVERINSLGPDYVFVLGDLTHTATEPQRQTVQRELFDRLDAPYYVAPGNHDLIAGVAVHEEWIGYRYKLVSDPNASFLLFDSNDDLEILQSEVEALLDLAEPAKPIILLGHHRIWKRHLRFISGQRVRKHHTRALWRSVQSRIDSVFAGDATRRFEAEVSGKTRMYSVGLYFSGRCLPVYFALGVLDTDGQMRVRPVYLDLPTEHPWHTRRLTDLPTEHLRDARGLPRPADLSSTPAVCEGRGAYIRVARPPGSLIHGAPQ
jgi:3',5'-cyclic AMP phosphodiesterase CpdA